MRRALAGGLIAAAVLAGAGGAAARAQDPPGEPVQYDAAGWADAAAILAELVSGGAPVASDPLLTDPLTADDQLLGAAAFQPDPPPYAIRFDAVNGAYDAAPVVNYAVEFNAGVLPEPFTWGMMIIGFFGAGFLLRHCKEQMLAAWPAPEPS